jgi:hypothetical protein
MDGEFNLDFFWIIRNGANSVEEWLIALGRVHILRHHYISLADIEPVAQAIVQQLNSSPFWLRGEMSDDRTVKR